MSMPLLIAVLAVLAGVGFVLSRRRVLAGSGGDLTRMHSLPGHYGWYAFLTAFFPGLAIVIVWLLAGAAIVDNVTLSNLPASLQPEGEFERRMLLNDLQNLARGGIASSDDPAVARAAQSWGERYLIGSLVTAALALAATAGGLAFAVRRVAPDFRARNMVERYVLFALIACSTIAVLTTVGIILSLLFESLRFFREVPLSEFLFGLQWSPQTALRADQVGSSGAFGAIPLFVGTLVISFIAMLVAVPVGLMSAVYMTQYASPRVRNAAKPVLEVLAGVPTVVYGFFAALTVAPALRDWGQAVGLDIASESALAAGLVMGIMIIPFMSSLSDDALTAVPGSMRDGAYALGATKSETITQVLIPAALPGIVGAFLLSISRAIGETMIVVMAAGLAANLSLNPLDAVTTVTVQIVTLLTGDQEFDSAKTLSAFALGLVLFTITLALNIVALRVVRRYRESYE